MMDEIKSRATLNRHEAEYFKQAYAEAVAAENYVSQAQDNFAQKNAIVIGFVQYMTAKYSLPNGSQITPQGEIIVPTQ